MALVAMAKALAIFVGYKETKYDDPLQVEDTTTSVDGLTSSLGGAASKAKELKKILMGFDVLNVITTPSESSGGGGGGSATSIDPAILNALKDYDNLMAGVEMKATRIRDRIMEWLGFKKIVNEETGEISWELSKGYTNLEKIRDILLIIIGIFAGVTILKKIISLVKFVKELKLAFEAIKTALKFIGSSKAFVGIAKAIGGISSTALIVIGVITALVAVIVDAYKNDEDFRKSVDKLINSFKKLIDTIKNKFKPLVDKLLPLLKKGFEDLKKVLTPVVNIIKEILKMGLQTQIEGLGTTLEVIIKLIEGDLDGALDELKKGLENTFKIWKEYFETLKTNLSEWVKNGIQMWSNFFTNLINILKQNPFFNFVITKFEETFNSVKTAISNKVSEIKEKLQPILDKVVEIKNKIIEIFTALWKWAAREVKEKFVDPTIGKFEELKNKVSKKFEEIKSAVKEKLQPIVNWIDINIISKISKSFDNLKRGISNAFSGLIDNVIYNISIKINSLINLINRVIRKVNSITGSNIEEIGLLYNQGYHGGGGATFANGGFPDVGQMFIAREAGPELVGTIGNRTAVVNNQQIVESVSRGVAQAVSQVMNRQQGGNYNFYLDSQQITAVVTKRQNRNLSVMGV